ncbi:MAG: hypothetical protein U0P30_00920 [Vicinamibacterales bacterium]
MTEPRKRRWWPIVAGVFVLLCVVVAGIGVASVLWFRDKVEMRPGTSRADADAAFAAEKARFTDPRPMMLVGDDRRTRIAPDIEGRANPGAIDAVHVLAWNPDDGHMATITLPFWLVRMKAGTFRLGSNADSSADAGLQAKDLERWGPGGLVELSAKDLERYGPGIVLETESPKGDRVLITTR